MRIASRIPRLANSGNGTWCAQIARIPPSRAIALSLKSIAILLQRHVGDTTLVSCSLACCPGGGWFPRVAQLLLEHTDFGALAFDRHA